MAVTATRKTYSVAYELFDGPDKIPSLMDMMLNEGYRVGVSARMVDDEPEYRVTASKVLGDEDDPQAQVSRVSVTVGEVVVNDNGLLSQQEADSFLAAYEPPADKVSKLEAVRDARVAKRAAVKKGEVESVEEPKAVEGPGAAPKR